jgi:VRR-NUC domain
MKRSLSLIPTEEQEHLVIMDWVATQPQISQIFVHHALERKCHPWQGSKFKRLGVKAGYPDFSLPLANKTYHGLFLELKRRNKNLHPTVQQKWWIDYLNSAGYFARVAHGAKEAIEYIKSYLKDSV